MCVSVKKSLYGSERRGVKVSEGERERERERVCVNGRKSEKGGANDSFKKIQ